MAVADPPSTLPDAPRSERADPEPVTEVRQRRLPWVLAGVFVIVGGAIGLFSWFNLRAPKVKVSMAVPDAPRLVPSGPGQVVYRLDASRSTVAYEVEEILAGRSNTARGSTSGIAGDVLIDTANPSASRIGEIVVNVEQLTSDQSLRDDRLRHDFLESTRYPLARLRVSEVDGWPDRVVDGASYQLRVSGELEVKSIARPVTFDVVAQRDGDELSLRATTTVQLAEWGVGPISLGPLARTGRDARLIIDAKAIDARKGLPYQPGTGLSGSFAAVTMGSDPSFSTTVQPVLERRCASCHNPGKAGEAAWRLDTAADVARHAGSVPTVVRSGYMPPWPASTAGVPLLHERRLSTEEVDALVAWASAGGPLDVDPGTEIRPPADDLEAAYQLRRDLVMEPDDAYQGSTDLVNDYRCFVFDPGVRERTFVTGFEFLPDQLPVVHHALVFKASASQRDRVRRLDEESEGTGWQCFAGMSGPGGEQSPTGQNRGSELVAGWVPGQRPNKLPDGAGIKLEPGDFFVVQVHYHFAGQAPPDRSKLAVDLETGAELDEIVTRTYLGPAEIPCRPGEQGPLCDREAVLDRLTQDYGAAARAIANGLLLLCNRSLEQVAVVDAEGIARSSCEHRVVVPGEIVGVLGHLHQIGMTFRMTLNPGTPDEKVLLDIPSWDFNWQLVYTPAERIEITRNDTIRIECSWDRDLITAPEPRYVTWAEGTEDEMCYSTISVRVPKRS